MTNTKNNVLTVTLFYTTDFGPKAKWDKSGIFLIRFQYILARAKQFIIALIYNRMKESPLFIYIYAFKLVC